MRISLIDVSGKAEYYKAYARMHEDYVYDLQKKDSRVEDFSLVEFYQFFHDKRFKHYMLTLVNMPMGFIIIEEKAGGQHICETYIEPEYRSRGYGHRLMKKIFEKYPSGFGNLKSSVKSESIKLLE